MLRIMGKFTSHHHFLIWYERLRYVSWLALRALSRDHRLVKFTCYIHFRFLKCDTETKFVGYVVE